MVHRYCPEHGAFYSRQWWSPSDPDGWSHLTNCPDCKPDRLLLMKDARVKMRRAAYAGNFDACLAAAKEYHAAVVGKKAEQKPKGGA